MSSNINPNNIDTTFPVAGQDNDSQGFRDNFTNIKNNFTESQTELNDLQSKVILKSALAGGSLDNNLDGAVLKAAKVQDFRETVNVVGTVTGSQTLNYAAGHYHTLTTSGSVTVAFSNLPATANHGRLRLAITVASASHTLTLPSAVSQGTSGIQGYSANVITFASAGTYIFEFTTSDGGTTIHVAELSRPRATFMNGVTGTTIDLSGNANVGGVAYIESTEEVADGGAISLTTATSYFATGGSGETATLAAGTAGQLKTLIMSADGGGDMVITVTNTGWASGTLTFDTVGDACSLQYVNSKWYVIGNNGVTFA
jgi:hypothetical protein